MKPHLIQRFGMWFIADSRAGFLRGTVVVYGPLSWDAARHTAELMVPETIE